MNLEIENKRLYHMVEVEQRFEDNSKCFNNFLKTGQILRPYSYWLFKRETEKAEREIKDGQ